MPSYTRRQIALLLILVAAAGAGLGVGRWRQRHAELVEQIERFDQTSPEPTAVITAPPSHRTSPSPPASRKRFPSTPERDRTLAGPIDVNQATASDLRRLPGIGQVLATRIVEARKAGGPFTSVDDLRRVNGIGKSKLERVRTLVTVSR